jgi:hypothetical protein
MVVASLKLGSVCRQLGIEGVLGRRRPLPCAGNSGPKLLDLSPLRCSLHRPEAEGVPRAWSRSLLSPGAGSECGAVPIDQFGVAPGAPTRQ